MIGWFASFLSMAMAQELILEGGLKPLQLTGVTFDQVVKADSAERVIFFCVAWLDECEELKFEFRKMALQLWQVAPIRYAEVDCARDKVLCNREGVETYPSVNRYIHGRRVQVWQGSLGSPNLQSQQQELLQWIRSPAARVAANVVQDDPDVPQVMADLRSAVHILVFISASLAFLKLCLDTMRLFGIRASSKASEGGNAFEEAMERANSPACRLARRLPQSWVVERGTIEM
mmetsp:Transcript_55368/g.90228  ORF Transcript_55368/g.90228 Transcript_55368/m.90228 type:complete len:232 (+) Transcript_55368:103-798(+)